MHIVALALRTRNSADVKAKVLYAVLGTLVRAGVGERAHFYCVSGNEYA